ncbi:hypothetical protein H7849_15260 [Alloacidobacterium dinghuense]|uniref:Uncharacterized protein n=1 Tax=Alloacidobacterium dinghuense TaxID=2763107 RepID=A0A7G8BD85_9BACT|nr:hypothetical protein [Alloacidobacterium dinghuense]QNI30505.1 hypothetical protein H7849_15260 [Alloacidobacterium dinghuense]
MRQHPAPPAVTIRDENRASDVITRLRAPFKRKTVVAEPCDLNEATREVDRFVVD